MTRPPGRSRPATKGFVTLLAIWALLIIVGVFGASPPQKHSSDGRLGRFSRFRFGRSKKLTGQALVEYELPGRRHTAIASKGLPRRKGFLSASSTPPTRSVGTELRAPSWPDAYESIWPTQGVLIVSTVDGVLHALDLETGQTLWSFGDGHPLVKSATAVDRSLPDGADTDSSAPPLVFPGVDGSLFVAQDGTIDKLPVPINDFIHSTPYKAPDGIRYTGKMETHSYLLSTRTGCIRNVVSSQLQPPSAQCDSDDDLDAVWVDRTDYHVHATDTSTNREVWNISLGKFSGATVSQKMMTSPYGDTFSPEDTEEEITKMKSRIDNHLPRVASTVAGGVFFMPWNADDVVWQRDLGASVSTVHIVWDLAETYEGFSSPLDQKLLMRLDGSLIKVPITYLDVTLDDEDESEDNETSTTSQSPAATQAVYVRASPSGELFALHNSITEPGNAANAGAWRRLIRHKGGKGFIHSHSTATDLEPTKSLQFADGRAQSPAKPRRPRRPFRRPRTDSDDDTESDVTVTDDNGPLDEDAAWRPGHCDPDSSLPFPQCLAGMHRVSINQWERQLLSPTPRLMLPPSLVRANGDGTVPLPDDAPHHYRGGSWLQSLASVVLIIGVVVSLALQVYFRMHADREEPARSRRNSAVEEMDSLREALQLRPGQALIGKLVYDTTDVLGRGSNGTIVYNGHMLDGTSIGRPVAVKRLVRSQLSGHMAALETELLILSDQHPNMVRYYTREVDDNFIFLALEKCDGSLSSLMGADETFVATFSYDPPREDVDEKKQNEHFQDTAAATPSSGSDADQKDYVHLDTEVALERALEADDERKAQGKKRKKKKRKKKRGRGKQQVPTDTQRKAVDEAFGSSLSFEDMTGLAQRVPAAAALDPADDLADSDEKSSRPSRPESAVLTPSRKLFTRAAHGQVLQVIRDVVSAVKHLHSLGIVHRDLKPHNILMTREKKRKSTVWRAKVADMGFGKTLERDHSSFDARSSRGSYGWQAPEVILGETRLTKAVDVFSLGCVIYYILTEGGHPFGNSDRQHNITNGKVCLDLLEESVSRLDFGNAVAAEGRHLIGLMVAVDPKQRISSMAAYNHPLLWNSEKRLLFLDRVSDRVESEPADGLLRLTLEANADIVLNGRPWDVQLDEKLLNNLGQYRKYNFRSVRDLLRVVRNKAHHFRELPSDLRKALGAYPSEFLRYFTDRFPQLVLYVYRVFAQFYNTEPEVADSARHRVQLKADSLRDTFDAFYEGANAQYLAQLSESLRLEYRPWFPET